jgi:hypothetical protein
VKLPVPPAAYDRADQAQVRGEIERADGLNAKRGAAQPAILLSSPDGTTWKGVIDNAGALSWTAVTRG